MHYPGMKAGPSEGQHALDASASWRFESQMRCIGEKAQHALLDSSVLILFATPLGARIAKKLLGWGVGRIGIFGDAQVNGAHDFSGFAFAEPEGSPLKKTVISELLTWAKTDVPWATVEPFRDTNSERRLDDIARGFQLLIAASPIDFQFMEKTIALAETLRLPMIVAQAASRNGWCALIPPGSLCAACLTAQLPASINDAADYALIDAVASRASALAADSAVGSPQQEASVFHITRDWNVETRRLRPLPACEKCTKGDGQ